MTRSDDEPTGGVFSLARAARSLTLPASVLASRAAQILLAANLAIAWPLFRLADLTPGYLFVYHCDGIDILLLVALTSLVPAAVMTAVAGRHGRISDILFLLIQSGCFFSVSLQLIDAGRSPAARWGLAALAGVVVAVLLSRLARWRGLCLMTALAALWIPADFLLLSTVSAVVFGDVQVSRPPVECRSPAPIVMVVFDEIPLTSLLDDAGQIDERLFPNFRALAGSSNWYRNATSVDDYTNGSVPSMLTGCHPKEWAPPDVRVYPDNLFTLLDTSYAIVAQELTSLVGSRTRYGHSRLIRLKTVLNDAAIILPPVLSGESTTGPRFVEAVKKLAVFAGLDAAVSSSQMLGHRYSDFLASLDATHPRTLFFLHLLLPHAPWCSLPDGTTYVATNMDAFKISMEKLSSGRWIQQIWWGDDAWLVHQNYQRHLLQTMNVDRMLGLLVKRLRDLGLYDRTLLIVTSDHGASFAPGGNLRDAVDPGKDAARSRYATIYPVPLFMKLPGQTQGRVDDRNVELIDIVPTVADVLGAKVPWKTDGSSLIDPGFVERPFKRGRARSGRTMTMEKRIERKFADARAYRRWFAPSAGAVPWVYRLEPHGALIGSTLAGARIEDASGVKVVVDLPPDVGRPRGPLRMRGHVLGTVSRPAGSGPEPLLIARNGVVVSVTRTLSGGRGPDPFVAFLPDSGDGLDAGLEFFVVRSAPGAPLVLARPAVTRNR